MGAMILEVRPSAPLTVFAHISYVNEYLACVAFRRRNTLRNAPDSSEG